MKPEIRKKLVHFDLENCDALREAGRRLIPHLDMVLKKFYARALADPENMIFFENDARVNSARSAQKRHWEMLLGGEFGSNYVDSTERIGRTHARINLPLETYLSSYACAASDLIEVLMKDLARGRVVPYRKNDAVVVGALTRALALDIERVVDITFAVWGEEQNIALGHLGTAIEELSHGNLAHQIPSSQTSDYPASYDEIREQFNAATQVLASLVQKLDVSMRDLLARFDAMTDATNELSSRTAGQSATLEETAAAMSQLTDSISSSATKTLETRDVGSKAKADVTHGATVIANAAQAMMTIQKSSESISNITAAIDDVAFQTNLLALNAGVEAARAGDAGKGFAVVASEVRSLAMRSSGAAKDIKNLISTSGRSVDEGAELIHRADAAFQDIVTSFDQVAELTESVAASFQEQHLGITEINTAIHEMDRTTQMNASMVEQTLNSMQQMRDQAKALQRQIANLRFANDGFTSGAAVQKLSA